MTELWAFFNLEITLKFFGKLAFFTNYLEELNETLHKCLLSNTDLFQTSCITLPCILTELWAFLDLEITLKFYGKLAFFQKLLGGIEWNFTQVFIIKHWPVSNKLHNSTLHFDRVMGLFGIRNSTPSGNLHIILRTVECAVFRQLLFY